MEPYTDDDLNYGNDNSRMSKEDADESLRDVELITDTAKNWDSYDIIFLRYYIWWGIVARPVDGFVGANDFPENRHFSLQLHQLWTERKWRTIGWNRRLAERYAYPFQCQWGDVQVWLVDLGL